MLQSENTGYFFSHPFAQQTLLSNFLTARHVSGAECAKVSTPPANSQDTSSAGGQRNTYTAVQGTSCHAEAGARHCGCTWKWNLPSLRLKKNLGLVPMPRLTHCQPQNAEAAGTWGSAIRACKYSMAQFKGSPSYCSQLEVQCPACRKVHEALASLSLNREEAKDQRGALPRPHSWTTAGTVPTLPSCPQPTCTTDAMGSWGRSTILQINPDSEGTSLPLHTLVLSSVRRHEGALHPGVHTGAGAPWSLPSLPTFSSRLERFGLGLLPHGPTVAVGSCFT